MKINPAYQARSKNLKHPTQWCSPLSQFLKTTSAKQKMHSHFIYPFESTSQSIQNEKKKHNEGHYLGSEPTESTRTWKEWLATQAEVSLSVLFLLQQ